MQIAIEDYRCYYQNNDGDDTKYLYKVDWDGTIANNVELNDIIRQLRDTLTREMKREKPIAIAVFVCGEEKTLGELAEELG